MRLLVSSGQRVGAFPEGCLLSAAGRLPRLRWCDSLVRNQRL